MSELDDQLSSILRSAERKLAHERGGGLYTFHRYGRGCFVSIDLVAEEVTDGITLEPDQTIEGRLVNHRQALLRVENATHQPGIIDREVILGVCRDTPTSDGAVVHGLNLRGCVAPGSSFAYYFPEVAPAEPKGGFPKQDDWHNFAVHYGRVVVDGNVIFDVTDGANPV